MQPSQIVKAVFDGVAASYIFFGERPSDNGVVQRIYASGGAEECRIFTGECTEETIRHERDGMPGHYPSVCVYSQMPYFVSDLTGEELACVLARPKIPVGTCDVWRAYTAQNRRKNFIETLIRMLGEQSMGASHKMTDPSGRTGYCFPVRASMHFAYIVIGKSPIKESIRQSA